MLEQQSWQEIRQAPAEGKQGHNLGAEILAVAISDLRTGDCQTSRSAEAFLYPETPATISHFAWVLAMMPKIDAAWLRDRLDAKRTVMTPNRMCVGERQCDRCKSRGRHAVFMRDYQRNRRAK